MRDAADADAERAVEVFTGIVSDVGEVVAVEDRGDRAFRIATAYDPDGIAIGASIACAGVCLTVIDRHRRADGRGEFTVEASAETLSKTTLGGWRAGTRINLERALRAGDEMGGHIVSGHVDGVGRIDSIRPEGGSHRLLVTVPTELARFITPKGSVALDGTSLTVNEVEGSSFGANLVSHTLAVTTWGTTRPGDRVNVEIDVLARYVARLLDVSPPKGFSCP
jgi:riboflavin synthase